MDFNSLKMRQFEDSAIHIAIEEKSSDETQDDSDDLIYTEVSHASDSQSRFILSSFYGISPFFKTSSK